jgi:DNA end-binding protein Ku
MQTVWKGAIAFGLVTIPVRLFSATAEHDVPLHQVHAADGSRVRYKRFCEAEGVEIPYAEIAKGYQMPDGDVVVLTDSDLQSLPLTSRKTIEVEQFVPAEQLEPIAFSKPYFIQADGAGTKPYVLLREALVEAGTVAVVRVALRGREALATLRPYGDVLVLQTMLWPDELRDPAALAPEGEVTIRSQERAMAASYIETLTGDFDHTQFSDEYNDALRELVEAKSAGKMPRPEPAEAESGGEVIDLVSALERSVAEARARRSGKAGAAAGAPKPMPATAAGKTAGKTAGKAEQAEQAAATKAAAAKAATSPAKATAKKATPARTRKGA